MHKRAQITVFIIIGLLAIFGVAMWWYYSNSGIGGIGQLQKAPEWALPVQNYVRDCLEQSASAGIYLLSAQGGLTEHPEPALVTEHMLVGYHVYGDKLIAPTKDEVQLSFDEFVESVLPACMNRFRDFPGYEVEQGKPKVTSMITQDNVLVRAEYPLTIVKGDLRTDLDEFAVEVPVRLGKVIEVADSAARRILESPDKIILDRMLQDDVALSILPYDENTLVYALRDPVSDLEQKPYVFFFASKLDANIPPKFDFVPDFVLTRGKKFTYQVVAHDPDSGILRYSDNTQAFDIDPLNGEIAFTPMAIGRFVARITVSDGRASDQVNVAFEVRS